MSIQSDQAQLSNDIRQLSTLMRQLIQGQSHLAQSTMHVADSMTDAGDAAYEAGEKLRRDVAKKRKLTEEERYLLSEFEKAQRRLILLENKKLEVEAAMVRADEARKNRVISQSEYDAQKLALNEKLHKVENQILRQKDAVRDTESAFTKAFKGVTSKLHVLVGLLSTIGGSMLKFNAKFMEATAASAGVIEETTGNFDQGMGHWLMALNATGVASEKVLGILAQNRQLVNAMGGMTNTIKEVESAIKDTRGLYGSQEEALKQNVGILTSFANKGVKPSITALKSYNADLDMLARQTGMSGEAMNAMINSISEDTDSITILRAARDGEREAILANQRALLKSNIALGMTAQQATEAAKMLNKMVAQKPLERLKQAAKMRALGAAMGLGPESERAAQAITAGKRATAQQRQDLNNFATQVTNAADQAATQGLTQEIFTAALLEKLDFESYFGSGSPFSTTLADTNKSILNLSAQYKSSSDSTIVQLNYLADIAGQMLNALLDGTLLWGALLDVTRGIGKTLGFVSEKASMGWEKAKDMGSSFLNAIKDAERSVGLHPAANLPTNRAEQAAKAAQVVVTQEQTAAMAQNAVAQKREVERKIAERKKTETAATPTVTPVTVVPNPITESTDKMVQTRAEEVQKGHTDLLTTQINKIDDQLKLMNDSNKYLKIISDAVPTLVDLAGKQLAAATMNEEQRKTMASKLKSENAKFNTDYSYAL